MQGAGCRVQGVGFGWRVVCLADADHADDGARDVAASRRVQQHLHDAGFRVQGAGCKVQGAGSPYESEDYPAPRGCEA